MSAISEIEKRHEIVEKIKEEKPFKYIVENLENTFGEPILPPKSDTLAILIPNLVFLMVASYITAACWFTASTSFANPAAALARSVTDTFAGINPSNVLMFIIAQLLGAFSATFVFNWLLEEKRNV